MYSNAKEAKNVLLVCAIFIYYNPSNFLHRFLVPHDRLFLDALECDLKREKMELEPTTQIATVSFTYDPNS